MSPLAFSAVLPPSSYGVAPLCRRFDWRWPTRVARINPFSLSPRARGERRHDRGRRAGAADDRHRRFLFREFGLARAGDAAGAATELRGRSALPPLRLAMAHPRHPD